jgi:hypothetical protein
MSTMLVSMGKRKVMVLRLARSYTKEVRLSVVNQGTYQLTFPLASRLEELS